MSLPTAEPVGCDTTSQEAGGVAIAISYATAGRSKCVRCNSTTVKGPWSTRPFVPTFAFDLDYAFAADFFVAGFFCNCGLFFTFALDLDAACPVGFCAAGFLCNCVLPMQRRRPVFQSQCICQLHQNGWGQNRLSPNR